MVASPTKSETILIVFSLQIKKKMYTQLILKTEQNKLYIIFVSCGGCLQNVGKIILFLKWEVIQVFKNYAIFYF